MCLVETERTEKEVWSWLKNDLRSDLETCFNSERSFSNFWGVLAGVDKELKQGVVLQNNNMANRKITLTVTIKEQTIKKLKRLVPAGEVSKLIDELIEKEVARMETAIADEYRREAQDDIIDKEAISWYIIHKGDQKNEKK